MRTSNGLSPKVKLKARRGFAEGKKLELSLGCMDVPKMDFLSKSDPFCVLYTRNSEGVWEKIGFTETIVDSHTVKWVRKFFLDEELLSSQMKFEVYDRDSPRDALKDHDFIGSIEGQLLADMLEMEELEQKLTLLRNGIQGTYGTLQLMMDWIVKPETNYEVVFDIQVNYSVRSKMYYQLMKKTIGDSHYVPVLRSKLLDKTESRFESNSLKLTHLCGGDSNRTFRIELFEYIPNGRSKMLGFVRTTVEDLAKAERNTEFEWNRCSSNMGKAKVFVSEKSVLVPNKGFQFSFLE